MNGIFGADMLQMVQADSNYITGVQNKATTVLLFIICRPIIFAFAKLKDA